MTDLDKAKVKRVDAIAEELNAKLQVFYEEANIKYPDNTFEHSIKGVRYMMEALVREINVALKQIGVLAEEYKIK